MTVRDAGSQIPITNAELMKVRSNANFLLGDHKRLTDYAHKPQTANHGSVPLTTVTADLRKEQEIGLRKVVVEGNGDDILSDGRHQVLSTVRKGLQIGLHFSALYQRESGIESVDRTNLADAQKASYNEKMRTASAIAQFTAARYVVWVLSQYKAELESGENVDHVELWETEFDRPTSGLQCMIFYLAQNLSHPQVGSGIALVETALAYMKKICDAVKDREASFQYVEIFSDNAYILEHTKFSVEGFSLIENVENVDDVKEVYPKDIIGNTESVRMLELDLRKLFLYDVEAQISPILEMGGFASVQLMSGDPGNGKTLALAMLRTLARDYAEASGLPYKDKVVPSSLVSKYQGESGPLATAYIRSLLDTRSVNLGIADEMEQFVPDHGSDKSSEGDKAVGVAFLKGFSGVSTIELGNFMFVGATNYPTNIDPAFMSRIKSRQYITGAETIDDYMRFIVLNLRQLRKKYPNLINLKNIDWQMDTKAPQVPNVNMVVVDPTMTVEEIRDFALKGYEPTDAEFFARFFWMMKQRQKTFSLRDCANTIDGAKSQVASFEIPLEWITERRHYHDQSLEAKRGVLQEVADSYVETSGMNFTQILLEKSMHYATESLRMAETARTRVVEEIVERKVRETLAEKLLAEQMNGG